jgi:hypothetical protein
VWLWHNAVVSCASLPYNKCSRSHTVILFWLSGLYLLAEGLFWVSNLVTVSPGWFRSSYQTWCDQHKWVIDGLEWLFYSYLILVRQGKLSWVLRDEGRYQNVNNVNTSLAGVAGHRSTSMSETCRNRFLLGLICPIKGLMPPSTPSFCLSVVLQPQPFCATSI